VANAAYGFSCARDPWCKIAMLRLKSEAPPLKRSFKACDMNIMLIISRRKKVVIGLGGDAFFINLIPVQASPRHVVLL